MSFEPHGELIPDGGGDSYSLVREQMRVGRRKSCDIWLNFDDVSSYHCDLAFVNGVWQLSDLGSTNGTKVNGEIVQKRKLRPGDQLSIGKRHRFRIEYNLPDNVDLDAVDEAEEDVMSKPLLERAGLVRTRREIEREKEEDYNKRLLRELLEDDEDDD